MTKAWDEALVFRLRESYGKMCNASLAMELGVTVPALRNKAYRLGLTSPSYWPQQEIDRLVALYRAAGESGVVRVSEFAKDVGRNKANVVRKAKELGLPTNRNRKRVEQSEYHDGKRPSIAKHTDAERSRVRSQRMALRHKQIGHPMAGKKHTAEARKKISAKSIEHWESMTEDERAAFTLKCAKARAKKPLYTRESASWKAGWREIADKRNYYRSRWEANYARYLQWLKERGEIREWAHEPETFWFEAIKRGVRSYKPDFRVWENDGSSCLHEVKGWMDSRSRTTLKRMAKYHPDQKIILIDGKAYRAIRIKVMGLIPGWEDSKRDARA